MAYKKGCRKLKYISAEDIQKFLDKGYTPTDIAEEVDICERTILKFINQYGISLEPRSKTVHIDKVIFAVLDFIEKHDLDALKYTLPENDDHHKLEIDDHHMTLTNTDGWKIVFDRIRNTFVYFKVNGKVLMDEMNYLKKVLEVSLENLYANIGSAI